MVSSSAFGLFAKTVALFLFGPPPPHAKIDQKEKVLVLMWTESFFTVYQALDWEFFSDAEGTFSHLSGPVRNNICRAVVKVCMMQDPHGPQNRLTQRILQASRKRTGSSPRTCTRTSRAGALFQRGKVLAGEIPSATHARLDPIILRCARTCMRCRNQTPVIWASAIDL